MKVSGLHLIRCSAKPPPDWIFCQDLDDEFGEIVPQQESREILQLTLSATPDAAGDFQLLMLVDNPDADSSWFDDEFNSWQFENAAESDLAGFVLLGTIHIDALPDLPGDYNGDRTVDQNDYFEWYATYGSHISTAGEGADGNADNVVNAADYVIWRIHSASSINVSRSVTTTTVPEPATIAFVAVGVFASGLLRRARFGETRFENKPRLESD